ncbi:hypothetical protein FRX31_027626, partial [Thalictrum thalictroides]
MVFHRGMHRKKNHVHITCVIGLASLELLANFIIPNHCCRWIHELIKGTSIRNCSDGELIRRKTLGDQLFGDRNNIVIVSHNNNKENLIPPPPPLPQLNSKEPVVVLSKNKTNVVPFSERNSVKEELLDKNLNLPPSPSPLVAKSKLLKSSSLQLCMHLNEPDSTFGLKVWDHIESDHSSGANVWDHSDSEAAAPASSWSTLPN